MKAKYFILIAGSVLMLGSGLTAYAQPKTMPDGTVFDAEFYANTYPDVKAAFGNDEEALYDHYVTYGKLEGRAASAAGAGTAAKAAPQAEVVSVETIANPASNRANAIKGTITTLADGTKIATTDKDYVKFITQNYGLDEQYLIPRTDYSTGLIDEDHNGIDDRDPYNSCGYTDLNYNCVADGAPCTGYWLTIDLPTNSKDVLPPEEVKRLFENPIKVYYTEEELTLGRICKHGIVQQFWTFSCQKCIDAINAISRQYTLR